MSKNSHRILVIATGAFLLGAMAQAWVMEDKVTKARSEAVECSTRVSTLTDSIKRLKSRSDTLTVIVEAASRYNISPDMAQMVMESAKRQNVDPKIALSLVQQESNFQTNAVSHVGAIGLTQVKPSTARIFDVNVEAGDLYDPRTNLEYGMRYLSLMLERYGNYEEALAAYNVGPTDWDNGINRSAGRRYATDVLSR